MRTAACASIVVLALSGVLAANLLLTGCESVDDAFYLTVSPESIDLAGSSNLVTFTVTEGLYDLSLPLVWSVSNPALGVIVASEGLTAVYSRTGEPGVNLVMVKDQYHAEGIATVNQR